MTPQVHRQLYLLLILAALTPAARAQTTIHVPADQPTIQQAIDAASNGDSVLVAAGTYLERLDFKGKAITLTSEQGPAGTIIDGAQVGSVLTFQTSETPNTKVIGFTIQNGNGSFGSGAYVNLASPTLTGNVFQGNAGGAIWGNSTSMLLERNLFMNHTCNSQNLNAVATFVNSSSPVIKNNVFANNHCPAIDVTLPTGNTPLVANNTIVGNDVGLQIDARVPTNTDVFRNNLLYGNIVGVNVMLGSAPNYPALDHNLVFASVTANYQGMPDPTGTNGNLSADPLLAGLAGGDYHPATGSPVIDAGLNSAVAAGDLDYYGGARVLDGGAGSALVDIGAVEHPEAPPELTFTASASSISLGQSATLTWSTLRGTACTPGGAWSGAGNLSASGSQAVTPAASGAFTYTLTCTGPGGSAAGSVKLTVLPPPAAPPPAAPASGGGGSLDTMALAILAALGVLRVVQMLSTSGETIAPGRRVPRGEPRAACGDSGAAFCDTSTT